MMSDAEFNGLLNGPLNHPLPVFAVTRLAMALRFVVDYTGEQGEKALREFCDARQRQDDNGELIRPGR